MGDAPRYLVHRIIGSGETEHLLCTHRPEQVKTIRETRRTVLVDAAEPTLDNVIVQGRLRVEWVYTVQHALWSTAAEESFALRIALPGSTSECECRVLSASVIGSSATGMQDCTIVRVAVQVLRQEELQVEPSPPQRPPVPRSVITRFHSKR